MFLYVLLAIFILTTLFLAYKYFAMLYDLKSINKRIRLINNTQTNILVDSMSMNGEVVKLVRSINENISHYNEYRAKVNHEEMELKDTIANISHDLRTPITSTLGYLQLFESTAKLTDNETKYLDIISGRLQTLKQLIENLFSYSLMIDSEVPLEIRQENINLILEDSIALSYEDLIQKGLKVNISIPEEPIYRNVDKLALKRVFSNLLSNVIKYGTSEMDITLDNEKVVFANGTDSVDQIDVGRIFDRFFTVKHERNNNSMGLGLTISKTLIEKMDGSISAALSNHKLIITIKLK